VRSEQIWAPWRLAYVKGEASKLQPVDDQLPLLPGGDPECFICQAVADTADRRRYVLARTPHSITILNLYPYTTGHLLVAPRLHRARLDELTVEEQCELVGTLGRMVALLEKVLRPQGFNVGLNLGRAAGAGLPGHLHWHVVPRWVGDTNFMPVVASVNVIPDSLDALWQTLTEAMSRS
jgi:ATP adenylyltransferase